MAGLIARCIICEGWPVTRGSLAGPSTGLHEIHPVPFYSLDVHSHCVSKGNE